MIWASRFLLGVTTGLVLVVGFVSIASFVDRNGGWSGIATSLETTRQEWRAAILPDPEFTYADLFKDPQIEAMLEKSRANGGPATLREVMASSRGSILQMGVARKCSEEAISKAEEGAKAKLEQKCAMLSAMLPALSAPWRAMGLTKEEWQQQMNDDPKAFERGMNAAFFGGELSLKKQPLPSADAKEQAQEK